MAKKSELATHRAEALKDLYGELEKVAGKDAGRPITERAPVKLERISTGSLGLDFVTGGGIPRGLITELYGTESGGKTTIVLNVLAQAQRNDNIVGFVDAEHSFDPAWAERNGLDLSRVLFHQPSSGEEALEVVQRMVKSGVVAAVAVDSVAALSPLVELEGAMGKAHVGLQARMMSQACRKLGGAVHRANTALIFINQLREKVGDQGYGIPETTPGGRALKFWAGMRLDVRRANAIKAGEDEPPLGHYMRVKVTKNKTGRPFLVTQVPLLYDVGLDTVGEVLEVGSEAGVFEKSGSWYNYAGERMGQGRAKACAWLRERPMVVAEVTPALINFLNTGEIAS